MSLMHKLKQWQTMQYIKDYVKTGFYGVLRKYCPKLQTPMDQVILQLKLRRLLPKECHALEMFGMHGLWHTMDYIKDMKSLDFFELDSTWCTFAKRNLSQYNVKIFNQDSIVYLKNTHNKYNFIVCDIPYSTSFYDLKGMPLFWSDLINASKEEAIIIINIHNTYLSKQSLQSMMVNYKAEKILDFFMVARNDLISYLVVVLKK